MFNVNQLIQIVKRGGPFEKPFNMKKKADEADDWIRRNTDAVDTELVEKDQYSDIEIVLMKYLYSLVKILVKFYHLNLKI